MAEESLQYDYMVNFEFELEDDDNTYTSSNVIKTDIEFDPENGEHWRDVAKTLLRSINNDKDIVKESKCTVVRVTSIAEDSDEIRELREILSGTGSNYEPFTI